jgi:hypothetical protein
LVWLFGISTGNVRFMILLHVLVWLLAFGSGCRLLANSLRGGLRERTGAIAWALITAVVCAQLATFWRPMLGVTVTKDFREPQRTFFYEHFYVSFVGPKPAVTVPDRPEAAPSLPTNPGSIPPPIVTPMSN